MKFIGSAKITQQGQVSIPLDVRKKLDLELGDYVIFVEDDDGRVIVTKNIALPED
ncbi:MAG: AbrB/MazE/SpoVT family DNA-binding domain-containing protein [Candidatus Heimdallarchaeota archaeon]